MRALPLLLLTAACAPTLQAARLQHLEKLGRLAFVASPRGWDRTELIRWAKLLGGPRSCVECKPGTNSDSLLTVSYSDYGAFLAPFSVNLRDLARGHGAQAAASTLGVDVVTSGSETLDELETAAVFHRYPFFGARPSLDTASADEHEVFSSLAESGFSTLIVFSVLDVSLKRERNSVAASLELRIYDTATRELVHEASTPLGWALERDIDPQLMRSFFPVTETGLQVDALARAHHRQYRPDPAAVAAVEQAIGGLFSDFVSSELAHVTGGAPRALTASSTH